MLQLANDASEVHEREIVIGRADREISRIAYGLLNEIPTSADDEQPRYLIYSDDLRSFGNSAAASEVVWALRERAPEAIRAATVKMAACRCDDGSYSYVPGVSSAAAQGLPVSVPTPDGEPANGDVNATVICTYGNIDYMFGALRFSITPSLCTDADRRNYFGYRSGKYPDAVPQNNIAQVLFYGQSGPHAIVYLDNTSFWGDGAKFSGEEINFVKELK